MLNGGLWWGAYISNTDVKVLQKKNRVGSQLSVSIASASRTQYWKSKISLLKRVSVSKVFVLVKWANSRTAEA